MNIACAFRWGVTSVGITLLGMAHLIQEKHFRCGIYVGGQLSFGTTRVEECQLVVFIIIFVNFLEQTSFGMYLYVKEL